MIERFTLICTLAFLLLFACWADFMLFPPKMIWQEFGRTPAQDLGLAGKNIPPEKARAVYAYRITLRDIGGKFSPGEYLEKYRDDVAINNLIFTNDKARVVKFMEEKGVKLKIVNAPYQPKVTARR